MKTTVPRNPALATVQTDFRDECRRQGDRIGRIVDYRAIVFFGHLLKISEVAQIFGLLLFNGKL
jgi:hypothetical protein